MKYWLFALLIPLSGCAFNCGSMSDCRAGPIHITHKHGEMPKIDIKTGLDNAKIKAREDKIYLEFKEKF